MDTELVMSFLIDFTSVVGTIWAVLSILSMKPSDIYGKSTWGGLEKGDQAALIQFKQARSGVSLILLSFAYKYLGAPIIKYYFSNISLANTVITYLLVLVVFIVFINIWNRNTTKKYNQYLKNNH